MKRSTAILLALFISIPQTVQAAVIHEAPAYLQQVQELPSVNTSGIHTIFLMDLPDMTAEDDSQALSCIQAVGAEFGVYNAGVQLFFKEAVRDEEGRCSYKFQQRAASFPVYGNVLIVHTNIKNEVTAITGSFDPRASTYSIDGQHLLPIADALQAARKAAGIKESVEIDLLENRVMLCLNAEKQYVPAYTFRFRVQDPETMEYWNVFVDAIKGEILYCISQAAAAAEGRGTGSNGVERPLQASYTDQQYWLRDEIRNIETYDGTGIYEGNTDRLPGSLMQDDDNVWDAAVQKAAVDAHANAAIVHDYYKEMFGRNSLDDKNMTIRLTVHYGENYNDAMWNGEQILFGDGDGVECLPLSGALDVVGHEITHAIVENTAELIYWGESGALDESFSDVFGNLIENKQDNEWLCAEDIYTPGVDGDALRSMSDPEAYGDPAHMEDYVIVSEDNGGVHTNAGIPNKAFFLTVQTVSREDTAKIWYRALTHYLTPTADFSYARQATAAAAADLFGKNSVQAKAVSDAWEAVGVKLPKKSNIPDDQYEPNDTTSRAAGPLQENIAYQATISSQIDTDTYRYVAGKSGKFTITLQGMNKDYTLELLDAEGRYVAASMNKGSSKEVISYLGKPSETYYIRISGVLGAYSEKPYTLRITATAHQGDAFEPNDSMLTSYNMGVVTNEKILKGTISYTNDSDWIKIKSGKEWGTLVVSLTDLPLDYDLEVWSDLGFIEASTNEGWYNEEIKFKASPNTAYYIRIYSGTGEYSTNKFYQLKVRSSMNPIMVSSYPANDMNHAPVDEAISVTFSHDIDPGPKFSAISLYCTVDERQKKIEVLCNIDGDTLLIMPKQQVNTGNWFLPDTSYFITLPKGAVKTKGTSYLLDETVLISFETESEQ